MMSGGTLIVSRAKKLYQVGIQFFEETGYTNVNICSLERDALFALIRETKPKILFIDCAYYQAATPIFVGEMVNQFPKLYVAAIAYSDYPLYTASWFIWHGAKSCLHLWADGADEFRRGFREIQKGNEYISPAVQRVINLFPEWPDTKSHITKRQFECLVLLCNGFNADAIAGELQVTRKTIDNTLGAMFDMFHVHSKEELICQAWAIGLVCKHDLQFYRRYRGLEMPEWGTVAQKVNQELEKVYQSIYGGNE